MFKVSMHVFQFPFQVKNLSQKKLFNSYFSLRDKIEEEAYVPKDGGTLISVEDHVEKAVFISYWRDKNKLTCTNSFDHVKIF